MRRPRPEAYFVIWRRTAGNPAAEKVAVVRGRGDAEQAVDRFDREAERDGTGSTHYLGPIPRDDGRAWMASLPGSRRPHLGPDRRPSRR